MKPKSKSKSTKSRAHLLHQYYNYTGFYSFVWSALKKALPFIILAIAGVYIINHFFDINASLVHLTETLPVYAVLLFFFVSETFLGLIPPEIFIAYSGKMEFPWLFLTVLAFLSYFGGLLSYHIGRYIEHIPSVHNYIERKMEKHLKILKNGAVF